MLGLSGVPDAGDEVMAVANERKAREAAAQRQTRQREGRLAERQAAKLQNLFENMGAEDQLAVNLVIRADVQGSVEALRDALTKLSNEDVNVNVVAAGVGAITESDAQLAAASNAIIIGFNVRADATARRTIQESELDLHYYSVIYDAIDEVKAAISGMLGTETKEQIIGLAEVKDVFRSSSHGPIAGCLVVEGIVKRTNPIRVLRDNVVIFRRRARVAAALQGRRQGSTVRYRVRHRREALQRRQARRPDRVLRADRSGPDALSVL